MSPDYKYIRPLTVAHAQQPSRSTNVKWTINRDLVIFRLGYFQVSLVEKVYLQELQNKEHDSLPAAHVSKGSLLRSTVPYPPFRTLTLPHTTPYPPSPSPPLPHLSLPYPCPTPTYPSTPLPILRPLYLSPSVLPPPPINTIYDQEFSVTLRAQELIYPLDIQ